MKRTERIEEKRFLKMFSVVQQHNSGLCRLIIVAVSRGRHLNTIQQTQEKSIHPFSGIRTRYPSNREQFLRPHGYRDPKLL